ncbi:MAG: cation diffusion facilitator family transporter [bacterium]|nr:cation diffusion facilitator family transporter [bacterium]
MSAAKWARASYTAVMAAQGSRFAVLAALVANSLIAVAKFIAAAMTGSAAMLAEAIHSVADSSNQGMLLWGMAVSKRQGGTTHPFGRGKEVYFWSFMVAVMLFVGGSVFSIQHGISALRHPHEVANFGISVAVLGGALVFESFSYVVAIKEFNRARGSRSLWRSVRETKDAALLVILFEDSAAVAGLVGALAGVIASHLTGDPIWDAVASIFIGVLLAIVAFFLAFETKGLLIGEAAGRRDRAAIRARVLAHRNVEQVDRLLTMQMGPEEILVNLDVELVDGLSGDEVSQTIEDLEGAIRTAVPTARNIFVEA